MNEAFHPARSGPRSGRSSCSRDVGPAYSSAPPLASRPGASRRAYASILPANSGCFRGCGPFGRLNMSESDADLPQITAVSTGYVSKSMRKPWGIPGPTRPIPSRSGPDSFEHPRTRDSLEADRLSGGRLVAPGRARIAVPGTVRPNWTQLDPSRTCLLYTSPSPRDS